MATPRVPREYFATSDARRSPRPSGEAAPQCARTQQHELPAAVAVVRYEEVVAAPRPRHEDPLAHRRRAALVAREKVRHRIDEERVGPPRLLGARGRAPANALLRRRRVPASSPQPIQRPRGVARELSNVLASSPRPVNLRASSPNHPCPRVVTAATTENAPTRFASNAKFATRGVAASLRCVLAAVMSRAAFACMRPVNECAVTTRASRAGATRDGTAKPARSVVPDITRKVFARTPIACGAGVCDEEEHAE